MPIGIADIILIFLITIGPLKALIVYATLAGGADAALRRQIAFRTVMVATIVALLFVVAGELLLQLFHISLAALKIAGGIILLLFALGMVMGGGHDDGEKPKAVSLDIAVYPLAMPMMSGFRFQCSQARNLPVRPAPVMTSSAISSTPNSSQISRMRR